MTRKYVCLLIATLTVYACMITGVAATMDREKDFFKELEIPSDFAFSVQEQCAGHTDFHHAIAQNDGKIVVFSHYIDPEGRSSETFIRQYVDIYHDDGSLMKEYSFCTEQVYAPALENDRLYLYFYGYVVTVDLETDELHCYDIVDAHVNERSDVIYQQSKTFKSGQWEYRCKQTLNGYTKLIRSNGTTEQIVVDMPGRARTLPVVFYVGSSLSAVVIVAISLLIMRKKKTKRNKG